MSSSLLTTMIRPSSFSEMDGCPSFMVTVTGPRPLPKYAVQSFLAAKPGIANDLFQLPCVVSALSNMSVMTETGMRESFWKYVSRQRTRKMYQFNETLLRLSIVSHECTKHDFTTREQTWLLTSKFMETFGTMFQILDFDELRQLHERMWLDHPLGCDAFALLALVFCIGNAFVPKESPHRLTQPVAYRWFETARGWRNSAIPVEKYNFQTLRVDILLYVARVLYGFGFPTDAVSSAMLVRNAMAMGLHRNRVTTARSAEEQQLRRNMWFTVLELDVQASLEAGLPPSCPDGSLREDVLPDLSDFPGRELLARSLSIRSRIADTLNRCDGDVSYEVVQDLHKELIKTVGGSLCRPQGTTVNDFVWNYAEIRLRRAFVALHWTFAVQDDTRFFFSRQVCLSMSSQILRHFLVNSDEDNYLRNLVRDQSTTFQNDAFPAALYLCYELLRGVSTPDVGNPLGRLSMLRQEAHELASRFVELAAGRVRESHYAELAYVTIATLSKYNQWGEQNGLEGDNEHTRAVLQNIADGVAQQCCELMAS